MRIKAIVRLTIDVKVGSVWGPDCTWDQIAKQATNEASKLIEGEPDAKARVVELIEVRCIPEDLGGRAVCV